MEVVVRAAIEAAVTNIYITMENKEERLGQYFGNYFREVRASLERSQRSKSVEDALTSLEQREKWFRDIAQLDGIKILNRGWPRRVVDRFRESGMEEAYRTIYSVLSSQTHGDADATVDYVIYKYVRIPGYDHQRATVTEGVFWMRLYLYYCLRIYALAALSYAGAFDLGGASAKILVLKEEIEQLIDSISAAFESESTALEAAAFGELDERRDGAEHV
jgi:hypothetical protein